MLKLEGKAALITGAASGLGRELALQLSARGCRLYLVDRDQAGLSDLQSQLSPGNHHFFAADLSDPPQRVRLMADLVAQVSTLNILINCAGIGSHSSLAQLSLAEVQQVLQVNTMAPLELLTGLFPLLAGGQSGCIVNIGSTAGEITAPAMSVYGASKAALHAFSRAVSIELSDTELTCLLVILGSMRDTQFVRSIQHPFRGQPGWYRRLDVSPAEAAGVILAAIEHGQSSLIYPGWHGWVIYAARLFTPLVEFVAKLTFRRYRAGTRIARVI